MEINNPPNIDYIKGLCGSVLRPKKIDIGPWNMDTSPDLYVTHGIADYTKILSITVHIFPDEGTAYDGYIFNLCTGLSGTAVAGRAILTAAGTQIKLNRVTAGFFDHVMFEEIVRNRGVIFLWVMD